MRDWKALVRAQVGPIALDPVRSADIVDEIAQHVAQQHAELLAAGLDDSDALARALAPLVLHERLSIEIARADRVRPAPPPLPPANGPALASLFKDVGYAVRLITRAPAFSGLVIATLAIGIGANTAIFSVVNAVLLRPLPFADPARIVTVGERVSDGSAGNVGYTTFLDWRDRAHGFTELAAIRPWSPTLVTNGEPQRIAAMRVSANFFHLLGIRPALGRDLQPSDDTPAGWRVVLISDRLWRNRFQADLSVVGRVLTMNDRQYQIVGVLPASFEPLISEHFYQRADMWAALGYDTTLTYACRSCEHLKAIGRVASGVRLETVRADIDDVQSQLRREHPADYAPSTMTLVTLEDELAGNIRPALEALAAAVALVLLIGCANVAHLWLARMARREHDLALRAALGASRGRLVWQLFVESALLALAGGGLGVALCLWGVPLLTRLTPTTISRLADARVDGRVLAFSIVLSLVTALLFGLLPALRASRVNLQASLCGDRRRTAQAPTSPARRLLIAVDVALAVVLLAGAGLMIRSVGRLLGVNPGFTSDHVLSMQISFVGNAYAENAAVLAKTDQMLWRLHGLPGVQAAAMAGQIPLGGNGDQWGFHILGRPSAHPAEDLAVERYSVTPEYFAVMGIPLLRGRLFSDTDRAASEPVMLIGDATARQLWPGVDPIGQRVRIGDPNNGPWRTIVGIVGNVRHFSLASPPTPQMYLPLSQVTDSFLTVVLRTSGDPTPVTGDARRAIWAVASDVPIYQVAPLTDLVSQSVGSRRFVMVLLTLFGAVALLLTAIGVYGVISYSVAERTREIGIRTALGASRGDIVRAVFGGGLSVVGAGLGAGLLVALAGTRYLSGSLFEVSPTDPATFVSTTLLLAVVATLAHVVPVVRALRVEPALALRLD